LNAVMAAVVSVITLDHDHHA